MAAPDGRLGGATAKPGSVVCKQRPPMARVRIPRRLPAMLAGGLTAVALLGLGSEVFRPGHHVHLGAGGQHHHHFFVGAHTHHHPPAGRESGLQEPSLPPAAASTDPRALPSHGDTSDHGAGSEAHEPEQTAPGAEDHARECVPAASDAGSSRREGPAPERDSSPGLIDGFTLDIPTARADPATPLLAPARIAPAIRALAFADPVFLPGGARAPPAASRV